MLDKCANPTCSETFRKLRDGRVFVIEVDIYQSGASGPPRRPQYFWLCNSCSRIMTVTVDKDKRVQVMPLPGSAPAGRAAS